MRQAKVLAELQEALAANGHDAREAVRVVTGLDLQALADQLQVRRTDLGMCLAGSYGREYPHIRRALEEHMGLAPYVLDALLEEAHGSTAETAAGG